ncbi:MAG: tandem-95 repeat protein [Pirellulaceae bacterium]|nr:tandem-95 repeat protein [Pirellulaceae bacterium]
MRRFIGSLCVVLFFASVLPAWSAVYYGDFDWRINGGNFVTPVRNQGSLGSCWAFSATAALESQFLINAGTPGVDLNLSEQHLVCDSSVGMGGHEDLALNYIRDIGITTEATLPYISRDTSPLWPLARPHTVYRATSVSNFCTGSTTTTSELKTWLQNTGPLSCAIHTDDWFNPGTLGAAAGGLMGEAAGLEMDFSLPDWLQGRDDPVALGPDDPVGDINHSVLLVGYKDVPSMPEGGYWIIKNSWGTSKGDDGYYFMKYGDVEKHSRIHAVTGNTYTTEVPSLAPVGVNDAYALDEDAKLVRYMHDGVLVNDTDINTPHDELTAIKLAGPSHGTLAMGSNGWFTYTPSPDYYGVDSFTYRVFDGRYYSNPTTVSLTVASVNDAPIAGDDFYSVPMDGSLTTYKHNGVLANDSDPDNQDHNPNVQDTLTVVRQSDPAHGQLLSFSSSGGWFTYRPNPGFEGLDSFTYKLFDGTDYSNLATVWFQVAAGAFAGEMAAVPEPSSAALLVGLVLGLAAVGRRKSSR